jgi:hypothetical protein
MSPAPRLEVALRPSRRWAWLLAVALGAVALVGNLLPLETPARLALCAALIAAAALAVRGWRRMAGADRLLWDGSAWQLRAGGEHVRLQDCRVDYVTAWLIVLSFADGRRRRHLPLFADAMTAEGFRQMQVLVRSGVLE